MFRLIKERHSQKPQLWTKALICIDLSKDQPHNNRQETYFIDIFKINKL
jgi:hypothetical protein